MATNRFDPSATVFLDFEASGLDVNSFPIEVGWAFLDGGSGSLLIRPSQDWDKEAWDPFAEQVHGIGWEELQRYGTAPRDVAEHLNRVLRGAELVLSDAPDQDSFWLRRLFEETPDSPCFELTDERATRRRCLGECGFSVEVDVPGDKVHRAEPDALDLAAVWRRALSMRTETA